MDIGYDPASPLSPFEQVRTRIAAMVTGGDLRAGERLPTVRTLASELGLAVNTVARSYRELEAAGIIETRGRQGTFVSSAADHADQAQRRAVADFVRIATDLNLGCDQALTLVAEEFAARGGD
ncbi:GntR family transcriptional regulator [Rarobacter incanus]|uniref:GntR family transcriptional regulator n=1 Tax=Rarobacter incanus TaxID=153494 RepID=UPI001FE32B96|nr:GntR family transcriptional regulator [Rarobacter incanus]